MKIADILKLDTNKAVQGTFTVTKVKKNFKDIAGEYMCRVLLTDPTGDMLADFHTIVYSPLQNGMQIELVEAMTQYGEDGKKLYVEAWEQEGEPISEPPPFVDRVVHGKIKTHLACAYIIKFGSLDCAKWLENKECEDIVQGILK